MLKYLSKVLYVLSGKRSKLLLILLMFVGTSVLEALGIGLIGPFITIASQPDSIHNIGVLDWVYRQLGLAYSKQFIPVLGLAIILVFCFKSVSYFLARSYIFKFAFDQKRLQMSRLLHAYLVVPYTFHLSRNTSTIIKNIILETNSFTFACLLPLLEGSSHLVVIVVLLLLLAQTSPLLLVMIVAIMGPIFILFYRLGDKFKKWGKIASETQGEMMRTINHGLGGLKETRVIGCESFFEQEMVEQTRKYERVATLFYSSQLMPRIMIETSLIGFVVLFISISQVVGGQSMEDLTAVMGVFAIATMRLIPASSQLLQAIGQIRNGSYALDMLYLDLQEIEKEGGSLEGSYRGIESQAMSFRDRVELSNITYRYPGNSEAALQDVSLEIKKGESIAFIGKSGAGKTTLVDVVLGLLEPESGDIRVDDVSVYNKLRYWQNLIGYIPQSIFLTDDTIERNIAFGVPDDQINSERLDKAIKAAQLGELVAELPKGIKTEVGERGVRLSGGQRQRIGIARALYHEREILVLDEATAALDNETERLVSDAITSLAGDRTLIIIAHRLTTVEKCDRVYVMERGRVVKVGSYGEVVLER